MYCLQPTPIWYIADVYMFKGRYEKRLNGSNIPKDSL